VQINIITAFDNNHVIGKNGELPWNLPEDLRYFRKKTENTVIVMGRITYESIGKPLPHRHNIVISRTLAPQIGITILKSPEDLAQLHFKEPVFIIGGSSIYEHFLPVTKNLYITHLNAEFDGDQYFPHINWSEWTLVEEVVKPRDNNINFSRKYSKYCRTT
jgi:dihydrofolate reductase